MTFDNVSSKTHLELKKIYLDNASNQHSTGSPRILKKQ